MMKRLFAAIKIEPGEDFFKLWYAMQQSLKHENIRWVEPANLHLTLKFFGETAENKIETINEVLQSVASVIEPFNLNICKTGIFGSAYNPRVIWFGFDEEKLLHEIGNAVLSRLTIAGFPSDRQNFVPHLTVGRIKKIQQKHFFQKVIQDFREIQLQKVVVGEFHLYESILKPGGAIYISQQCFKFETK
jgi:2'-5' RNA ligase